MPTIESQQHTLLTKPSVAELEQSATTSTYLLQRIKRFIQNSVGNLNLQTCDINFTTSYEKFPLGLQKNLLLYKEGFCIQ
jgi:hypothetical protein